MIDPTDNKTADLVVMAETQRNMQAVVATYGDNLPYSYDRVLNECAFFMEQSATSALELGKRLILLKEMEAHGGFLKAIGVLGISQPTASRVMSTAAKLAANYSTSNTLLSQVSSKSKLFELMVLDNDDLKELSDGGTVAGIKLDDVDRMSVRELRAALRESRETVRAKDGVLQGKNQKLDEMESKLNTISRKLTEKQGLLAQTTPEQEAKRLRGEVENVVTTVQIDLLTRDLPTAFRQLLAHTERTGISHDDHMRGWLASIQRQLDTLRDEFNIYGESGETGAWWDNDQAQAEAAARVAELVKDNGDE